MNLTSYTQAFKEEGVRKTLMREDNRTIADMAHELNVPYHSLRNWLRNAKMTHLYPSPGGKKRVQDWSAEERLQALLETHPLSEEELLADTL